MDLQRYKERAQEAARRVGPGLFRIFAIYVGVLAVLGILTYLMENPIYEWQSRALQFAAAGNTQLPPMPDRARTGFLFAQALGLLGRVVTAGWVALTLRAVRGGEYSWHDLWSAFPYFWKVLVITLLCRVLCALALCLFIFPGVLLFYNCRLSLYVLAEHPLRCMRQSRRLMVGERMNLLRLDLSCFLMYGLAALLFFFSSGILRLWRMPSLMILYAVFYKEMSYWRDPAEGSGGSGGR